MTIKNKIKLVSIDMDGTLLNSKKEVPRDFYDWVRTHPNIITVIASGRQYQTLARDFSSIKDKLIFITENGSAVYDNDNVIYKKEISENSLTKCIKLVQQYTDITIILCGIKSAYTLKTNDEDFFENGSIYFEEIKYIDDLYSIIGKDDIVEIALYVKNHNSEKAFKEINGKLPEEVKIVLSGESWMDIENKYINKGAAIAAIKEKFNIDAKECMAFGDYINDYEMLLECEESYCMENGREELKLISKYIADSNDNDGVMKILRNL